LLIITYWEKQENLAKESTVKAQIDLKLPLLSIFESCLRDYPNQCTVQLTKKSMLCRSSVDVRNDSLHFMMVCPNGLNQSTSQFSAVWPSFIFNIPNMMNAAFLLFSTCA